MITGRTPTVSRRCTPCARPRAAMQESRRWIRRWMAIGDGWCVCFSWSVSCIAMFKHSSPRCACVCGAPCALLARPVSTHAAFILHARAHACIACMLVIIGDAWNVRDGLMGGVWDRPRPCRRCERPTISCTWYRRRACTHAPHCHIVPSRTLACARAVCNAHACDVAHLM